MTIEEKGRIAQLQHQGMGYKRIASTLGIPVNGVKAYCRRHPVTPEQEGICRQCGAMLTQAPHRKAKKFCSDKCRMAWWNSHPEQVNRKAVYHLVCAQCGKPFDSYGNQRRKFCCRSCYIDSRRKGVLE